MIHTPWGFDSEFREVQRAPTTRATVEMHHVFSGARRVRSSILLVSQNLILEGNTCSYPMKNIMAYVTKKMIFLQLKHERRTILG